MNEENELCLVAVASALSNVSLSSSDASGSSWGGPALLDPLKGRSATLLVLCFQQVYPTHSTPPTFPACQHKNNNAWLG